MGLIDYLRPYTWDKQVETIAKTVARYPQGTTPSVIEPTLYARRLLGATNTFFIGETP